MRPPEWHPRDDRAFDAADRATRRVSRAILVGVPLWLVLLLLLPAAGFTAGASLATASLVALAVALVVDRLRLRLGGGSR